MRIRFLAGGKVSHSGNTIYNTLNPTGARDCTAAIDHSHVNNTEIVSVNETMDGVRIDEDADYHNTIQPLGQWARALALQPLWLSSIENALQHENNIDSVATVIEL